MQLGKEKKKQPKKANNMKRVLVITYYWPPAGGPGVQRTLKFCKYLLEFGWQPIVLTVKDGNYPAIDQTLFQDIPPEVIIIKTFSLEPFAIYNLLHGKNPKSSIPTHVLSNSKKESLPQKVFKWIRANLFIPDARIGWVPFLVTKGKQLIREYQPELIFSSSPPHSLQLGAAKLSKQSGIPLVCDLRDPWTEAFWVKGLARTKASRQRDKGIELKTLKQATQIITVSKGLRDSFAKITDRKIRVITNGFDEEDFCECTKSRESKFRICHTGNVRTAQFAQKFFDGIADLPQDILANLELHFFGNVHNKILNYIKQNKVVENYHFHGYVSHERVVKEICSSDILVVFSTNTEGSKGVLTAKLFEYLRTGNYIIAYGEKGCEIEEILDETECGKMFTFSESCRDQIIDQYRLWKSGAQVSYGNNKVSGYARKRLTADLVEIFEEL